LELGDELCSLLRQESRWGLPMLKWALIFLIIAVIAGIFGFTDIEAASATIAQWLFGCYFSAR
jgi:uncharacterized membrane protein YtjA (UPF0391 family)